MGIWRSLASGNKVAPTDGLPSVGAETGVDYLHKFKKQRVLVGLGEGGERGYEITYQRYATDYFTCLRSVRTACSPSSSTTH